MPKLVFTVKNPSVIVKSCFYSKKKLARPYVGVKEFNHEED